VRAPWGAAEGESSGIAHAASWAPAASPPTALHSGGACASSALLPEPTSAPVRPRILTGAQHLAGPPFAPSPHPSAALPHCSDDGPDGVPGVGHIRGGDAPRSPSEAGLTSVGRTAAQARARLGGICPVGSPAARGGVAAPPPRGIWARAAAASQRRLPPPWSHPDPQPPRQLGLAVQRSKPGGIRAAPCSLWRLAAPAPNDRPQGSVRIQFIAPVVAATYDTHNARAGISHGAQNITRREGGVGPRCSTVE
jgi:hypothetical protein